jgi:hypothetical protein
MNRFNLKRLFAGASSLLAVISLILLSAFTVSTSAVYAADEVKPQQQPTNRPGNQPTNVGKPDDKDKESGLYKRAETAVRENQIHIDAANKIVTKTQEWIDELKGKGKDATTLQTALTEFKAQIAIAQKANDDAKKTLQSPTGFDTNGQVKDREQARQTVLKLAKDLRDVKKALDKATFDFRRAITEARQALRGDNPKTPEATKKP